ncbi:MAG: NAD-dependent protein deacylase [Desulfohalobiaceae bacterium]|nr:NAD-dependent protein deacylase [Desulfohalobiaceae bacterium]
MHQELEALLSKASYVVAFTGAGISAESGVPTYRGTDGVWNKYDPAKYADVGYFFQDPSYYWHFFKDVRYPVLQEASPNAGHHALVDLEKQGLLKALITQNIDGLHQEAGSRNVLELHGNTRSISCQGCGRSYGLDEARARLEEEHPPTCGDCRGLLKPDVVLFGESLPTDTLRRAEEESRSCDLFLSIGSSLVVQPAASMPAIAKQSGARLVIVNMEETPFDGKADLVIRDSASTVLSGIQGG